MITFYNYSGDDLVLDKRPFLTNETPYKWARIMSNQDITSPYLEYKGETVPFNYCKISEFNDRYYFIDPPVWVSQQVWHIPLREDYLMSHLQGILATKAVFLRSEAIPQGNIVDTRLPMGMRTGKDIDVIKFNGDGFDEVTTNDTTKRMFTFTTLTGNQPTPNSFLTDISVEYKYKGFGESSQTFHTISLAPAFDTKTFSYRINFPPVEEPSNPPDMKFHLYLPNIPNMYTRLDYYSASENRWIRLQEERIGNIANYRVTDRWINIRIWVWEENNPGTEYTIKFA